MNEKGWMIRMILVMWFVSCWHFLQFIPPLICKGRVKLEGYFGDFVVMFQLLKQRIDGLLLHLHLGLIQFHPHLLCSNLLAWEIYWTGCFGQKLGNIWIVQVRVTCVEFILYRFHILSFFYLMLWKKVPMVVAANKSDIGHGDAATKARNKTSQKLQMMFSVTISSQLIVR